MTSIWVKKLLVFGWVCTYNNSAIGLCELVPSKKALIFGLDKVRSRVDIKEQAEKLTTHSNLIWSVVQLLFSAVSTLLTLDRFIFNQRRLLSLAARIPLRIAIVPPIIPSTLITRFTH